MMPVMAGGPLPTSRYSSGGAARVEYAIERPAAGMATVRVRGRATTGALKMPSPVPRTVGVTVRVAASDTSKEDAVHVPPARVPGRTRAFSFTIRLTTVVGTPVIENTPVVLLRSSESFVDTSVMDRRVGRAATTGTSPIRLTEVGPCRTNSLKLKYDAPERVSMGLPSGHL